jgi:DNA-binding PucR family transcriptional regulator
MGYARIRRNALCQLHQRDVEINKGSVADTAAQLFCHPNTIRHRLHPIEAQTGGLLAVPNQLAELCLAFEIRQNFREP